MKIKIISLIITFLSVVAVQAQVDRSVMPKPGPAPEINLEKPTTFDLDNGLKVLVVENHKLPKVTAQLVIDNKPHSESKPGTAAMLSRLLGSGTEKIKKDEYIEEIDFLGASINFGSESAYASSLSKFFPRIFELMAAGALHPSFTQEEFDAQKTKLLESLKLDDKNVGAIANRISGVLAFGKTHPYGEFATETSVKSISLEDVVSYYNTYFVPENAYLVVVGDITEDKVEALAKDYFQAWEQGNLPEATLPAISPAEHTQIDFVNMPNAVQSEFRVQNTVELQMSDEDYFPVLVANQILGGSFGSYLNMNLREKHGFTYGAGSNVGTDQYGASKFTARTSVRNAVTDSTLVQIMKEINRIRTETVSEEDLSLAKNKFSGNFVLQLEKPSTIADFALNIETKDLNADFYENYLKNINAVSPEDVMRVAKKYFKLGHMRIIIAGKGSEVAENLETIESLYGEDIPVVYFDKFGNKVEKPQFDKAIPEGVTAQSVLNKYIEAIGGKKALTNVNSVLIKAQATVGAQQLDMEMKVTKDGKVSTIVSMGGSALSKQVFNGETGYMVARGQKMPLNEEQIAAFKQEAHPFPELTASNAELLGIEPVNGADTYVVSFIENTKNYYNMETGLKVKSVKTVSQGTQTMSIPTTYSNYKAVKGIQFPFTISLSMGPQKFDFNVTEVKINEGVVDADFE